MKRGLSLVLFSQFAMRSKYRSIGRTTASNVGTNAVMLMRMLARKCSIYRKSPTSISEWTPWLKLTKDQLRLKTKLMNLL